MKKISTILLFALALHSPAFAALPPLFQGLDELKMIINDERLPRLLQSGEMIVQIQKVEKGYLIATNQHTLMAEVVYGRAPRPGPVPFHIEFQNLTPLKTGTP